MPNHKILIVEDEVITSRYLYIMLSRKGFQILPIARTADEAVEIALSTPPDLIIMDVRLEGKKDGVDAALEIKSSLNVPIIFSTGNTDIGDDERIIKLSNYSILFKPSTDAALLNSISDYLKKN